MDRRLRVGTVTAFVLGVALMIPFEHTLTRIAGVACLLAFIVLGVFAIATPEALSAETDGEPEA